MIGFYDYTVILTYLSLISAGTGIVVTLGGDGHPYLGIFFLLFCGLCDAFDGMVARTKKNRTDMEKKFGIQIDSLSDLVAFGVLPACIGAALLRVSSFVKNVLPFNCTIWYCHAIRYGLYAILVLYMLAALIRLAYFNITEDERQDKEKGPRKLYTGLPVTSSALIFPTVLLIQYVTTVDLTIIYFAVMVITGVAFLSKFKIKKVGLKGILFMVLLGAIEFILLGLYIFNK